MLYFPASITHLDDSIKSIVDALKSEGTYDNTIIIFASDVSIPAVS